MLARLLKHLKIQKAEAAISDGPLKGMTVVVTGTLEGFSREGAEDAVRKAGGSAVGSVSKNTSFVVAGENAGFKAHEGRRSSALRSSTKPNSYEDSRDDVKSEV